FRFSRGPDIFDRACEYRERHVAGLFTDLGQSLVKGSLGYRALTAPHDAVDELGHQGAVVNGVRKCRASFCNSSSGHRLLGASLRTLSAVLRATLFAIADSD